MPLSETNNRLNLLRKLLSQGTLSTQDDLRLKLENQKFKVTQSTISRDLRKLGAIKAIDPAGRAVYRLPDDNETPPIRPNSLADLIISMVSNGSLIVIHTSPGSASLIARHLDQLKPGGILGTLAGDDTIFIALPENANIKTIMKAIQGSFEIAK